jgi:hypothetical protein
MSKLVIWTYFYEPMRLGGSLWNPKGCEIEAGEPVDLGGGYAGHEIESPQGFTVVAEASSGAIVGPNLASVRKDIAEGDPEVMKEQVEKALTECEGIPIMSPDSFWGALKKARG